MRAPAHAHAHMAGCSLSTSLFALVILLWAGTCAGFVVAPAALAAARGMRGVMQTGPVPRIVKSESAGQNFLSQVDLRSTYCVSENLVSHRDRLSLGRGGCSGASQLAEPVVGASIPVGFGSLRSAESTRPFGGQAALGCACPGGGQAWRRMRAIRSSC